MATHEALPSDIDRWLAARGLARSVALRAPSFGIVPGLVAQSDLIATTVPTVVQVSGWAGQLRLLRPPFDVLPAPACLVWHQRTHTDARQRWFRSEVQGCFGSSGALAARSSARRGASARRER